MKNPSPKPLSSALLLPVLILLFAILSLPLKADKYKILYMNYPRLTIDGKEARVGTTFTDQAVIHWARLRQAIKVINLKTKRQSMLVARDLNEKGLSVIDILTKTRHLSTHDRFGNDKPLSIYDQLENIFQDSYNLLDSIHIPTSMKMDSTHYFQVEYQYGDTKLIKQLPHEGSNIVLDRTLFNVDGEILEPRDLLLTIVYVDDPSRPSIFVKDNVELFIVPEHIE